jgi:hypothetical protein
LLEGLAHEELQLPHLVAALEEAGQVVALDPELDAETGREALKLEKWGRGQGQIQARREPGSCHRFMIFSGKQAF